MAYGLFAQKEVSSVRSIIVYSDKEHSSLKFDADDGEINELAFIVNHDDLEKAFIDRISEISYEEIKTNKIKSLSVGVKDINLSFANDNIRQFKLAIGADGSNSWVRSQSSIYFKSKDFDQTAIVFNIKTSKKRIKAALIKNLCITVYWHFYLFIHMNFLLSFH